MYKKTINSRVDLKKFKVRLVARGDLQDPRTYDETYACTYQRKSIMLLLGIAIEENGRSPLRIYRQHSYMMIKTYRFICECLMAA